MPHTFTTTILQTEGKNATGIRIPDEIIDALGAGKKPRLKVTLNGRYSYSMTVATMGGAFMLSLSAEHRTAAGVKGGDAVEVALELDTTPPTIEVPQALADALAAAPGARAAFDALAFSARKEYVRQVNEAKAEDTRERRIAKIIAALTEGK